MQNALFTVPLISPHFEHDVQGYASATGGMKQLSSRLTGHAASNGAGTASEAGF